MWGLVLATARCSVAFRVGCAGGVGRILSDLGSLRAGANMYRLGAALDPLRR